MSASGRSDDRSGGYFGMDDDDDDLLGVGGGDAQRTHSLRVLEEATDWMEARMGDIKAKTSILLTWAANELSKSNKISEVKTLQSRILHLQRKVEELRYYLFKQCTHPMIKRALDATVKTLDQAHDMSERAKGASWFRQSKFKLEVRDLANGITDRVAELSAAVAMGSAQGTNMMTLMVDDGADGVRGQRECLEGDKHLFGHGVPQSAGMAFQFYTQSAGLGYAGGMDSLGVLLREGKGTAVDFDEAISWFRRAVDLGLADAAFHLAEMHELGHGVSKSRQRALALYKQAAEMGFTPAMTSIGRMLTEVGADGEEVSEEDLNDGVQWYRRAAKRGDPEAQNNLGSLYFTGAITEDGRPDYTRAYKFFFKAAQSGHAAGAYNMGVCHESGLGCERSAAIALEKYETAAKQSHAPAQASLGYLLITQRKTKYGCEMLRRAAEQGDADALYYLGLVYECGLGMAPCDHSAVHYYGQAANKGHALAHVKMGDFLAAARGGLERDLEGAYNYYRLAADMGVPAALNCLGILAEEGVLTGTPNYEDAKFYYEQAHGTQACPEATFNLGKLFENGLGVEPSAETAQLLFREAAAAGCVSAKVHLERLLRTNKLAKRTF